MAQLRSLVFLVLTLTLGSAGATFPAAAQNSRHLTFVMPNSPTPYLLAFLIAKDLGWYSKAGLDVDEKIVVGDANALRALISGDADVSYLGSGTVMQGFLTGAKIKILGAWQAVVDYQVIARKGMTKLDQVRDKRWATTGAGTMTQIIPSVVLAKHGFKPDAAQFVGIGGLAARYQAVLAGTVDATILDTYFATLAENSGKADIVLSVLDDIPGLGYNYIVTSKRTLDDPAKREATGIFVREAFRGVRLIVDHPEQAADVLAKRLKSNDAPFIASVLKRMTAMNVWGLNGGLERSTFDLTEQFYKKYGLLNGDVDFNALADPSFIDSALKALGSR
jgi:ABC-type nitrate/sulfonate/bicarbonate transport system substrate-binding protein